MYLFFHLVESKHNFSYFFQQLTSTQTKKKARMKIFFYYYYFFLDILYLNAAIVKDNASQ